MTHTFQRHLSGHQSHLRYLSSALTNQGTIYQLLLPAFFEQIRYSHLLPESSSNTGFLASIGCCQHSFRHHHYRPFKIFPWSMEKVHMCLCASSMLFAIQLVATYYRSWVYNGLLLLGNSHIHSSENRRSSIGKKVR